MRNLIVGIVFIIGGLQGEIVLKGTDSSSAIIAIGVVLVLLGLAGVFAKSKPVDRMEDESTGASGLPKFDPTR